MSTIVETFDLSHAGIRLPESVHNVHPSLLEETVFSIIDHKSTGQHLHITTKEWKDVTNRWFCWRGIDCDIYNCKYMHYTRRGYGYTQNQIISLEKAAKEYLGKKVQCRGEKRRVVPTSIPKLTTCKKPRSESVPITKEITLDDAIATIWSLSENELKKLLLDITYKHFPTIKDSFKPF